MLNNEHYHLIQGFFSETLTENEQVEFDNLMKEQAFSEELKFQNELRKQLRTRQVSYINSLKGLIPKPTSTTPTPKTFKDRLSQIQHYLYPLPRYAFSIGGLVCITTLGCWWANTNYSDRTIIHELYEPILNPTQAGRVNNEDVLREAKYAFFNKDFQRAERLLNNIQGETTVYYEAQGLLAYTYFKLGDFSKAIQQFNRLIESDYQSLPPSYQDASRLRWTRVLAYVGADSTEESFFQKELDYFINGESEIYRKKAQLLKEKLNSPWRCLVF